ncbi:hypothetical protein LUX73_41180 [Actinomadura madurae]|nr:hypothetical protein [Actinomadura madurae]MCQ0010484.1 hypothetical protein [Actinomadura madurae]
MTLMTGPWRRRRSPRSFRSRSRSSRRYRWWRRARAVARVTVRTRSSTVMSGRTRTRSGRIVASIAGVSSATWDVRPVTARPRMTSSVPVIRATYAAVAAIARPCVAVRSRRAPAASPAVSSGGTTVTRLR